MKRKIFVFVAMLAVATGMFFYAQKSRLHAEQKKDARPNILFILTDDQRWDTLGVYGNKDIKTPNMDKLAKEGARFDAAYIASPLCCPSRSVFLTGKYPHQTGVLTNERDIAKIQDDWVTVAKALNNAGYVTGLIGKAHIDGKPLAWGFKDVPVYLPGGASFHQNPILVVNGEETEMKNGVVKINEDGEEEIHPLPQDQKKDEGKTKEKNKKKKKNKRKGIVVQGLITEIFTDAAVKFLERHKNDRFFLWFASTAPHLPYYRDPNFPYDKNKLSPPPGYPNKTLSASIDWAGYYSTISHLDFHIGRILKKLHDLGLDKNTIIIFTSDNGFMMGSHGLEGKQVWYEESVRMPWLVRWTGHVKAGSVVKSPVDSADFFPTVLELAGAPMPDDGRGYEGISFLPALGIKKNKNSQTKLRDTAYSEVRQKSMLGGRHWQMAKKGNIKYVWADDGTEILYDMKKDPHEFKNIAVDKAYGKILDEMRALREKWLEQTPELADKIKPAEK